MTDILMAIEAGGSWVGFVTNGYSDALFQFQQPLSLSLAILLCCLRLYLATNYPMYPMQMIKYGRYLDA